MTYELCRKIDNYEIPYKFLFNAINYKYQKSLVIIYSFQFILINKFNTVIYSLVCIYIYLYTLHYVFCLKTLLIFLILLKTNWGKGKVR